MTALLRVNGLTARYGEITALAEATIEVGAGEAVALVGANGAGKTTLMKSVMGFVAPAAGGIDYDGRSLGRVPVSTRARLGIGYSPEGRRVFPGMTVRENLQVASRDGAAATRARLDEVYAMFPALAEKAGALGWQLSGGQQQMLAIGRALMTAPRLLLLDEPSLGLAPTMVATVFRVIEEIRRQGVTVLMVEQNAALALRMADRAYVMESGRIALSGRAADLLDNAEVRRAYLGG
jgi:branched-chain amino acid transport system ATP-binding protein